jgi:hypothetical protein
MYKKPLLLALAGAALALSLTPSIPVSATARASKLLQQFALGPTSLVEFGYSQSELNTAATHGLTSLDHPAIGSGLVALGGTHFIGITDRGPNLDHFPVTNPGCVQGASANGKYHPLAQFSPAVVTFKASGGVIQIEKVVNLIGVTGLNNIVSSDPTDDDASFLDPCLNTTLGPDQGGMDVEDLALLPNDKFIGVEENRPSIFIADLNTGVVEARFTPTGKPLPLAGYPVNDSLPAILANRRKNRGFEGVTVAPDARTAYTMTQSPLGSNASGSPYRNSRVIRIFRFDLSNPYAPVVTGQFIYFESPASAYTASGAPTVNQRDLKLSAMTWVAADKLLVLERSDESNRGGVRLILVDLDGATNIHGTAFAADLTPENVSTDYAANNVTPVATQVVFEEFQHEASRIFWTYKLEGLAIRTANSVDIINDNDFGIDPANANAATNLWTVRLDSQLPLGHQ